MKSKHRSIVVSLWVNRYHSWSKIDFNRFCTKETLFTILTMAFPATKARWRQSSKWPQFYKFPVCGQSSFKYLRRKKCIVSQRESKMRSFHVKENPSTVADTEIRLQNWTVACNWKDTAYRFLPLPLRGHFSWRSASLIDFNDTWSIPVESVCEEQRVTLRLENTWMNS